MAMYEFWLLPFHINIYYVRLKIILVILIVEI